MIASSRRAVLLNTAAGVVILCLPQPSRGDEEDVSGENRVSSSHSGDNQSQGDRGSDDTSVRNSGAPMGPAPELNNLSLNPIERIATGSGKASDYKDATSQKENLSESEASNNNERDSVDTAIQNLKSPRGDLNNISKQLAEILEDAARAFNDMVYFCLDHPAVENRDSKLYSSVGFCLSLQGNTYSTVGYDYSEGGIGFQVGITNSATNFLTDSSVALSAGAGIGATPDGSAVSFSLARQV